MLNLITGKQRSGKSYFCVTLIISYLRDSRRPIYTNLPINPDLLCDVACGGRLRNPSLYNSYLSRLHLFVDYSGRKRQSFKLFRSLNPDFVRLFHSSYGQASDYRSHLLIPCGRDNFMIHQFWRYTLSNSVVFFDEVYEIFGALDQLSKGRDVRKEMLSYAKQHGHFKDDLFLITHDPGDVDKIIRKSLNKQYVVRNSKYVNILDHRLFKGLRWPWQFFMIQGFEYGERESQDQFNVFPKQAIFACYNSFNVSDFLMKDSASADDVSSDTKIDHRANFVNFFRQASPLFLLIFCLSVGLCVFLVVGVKYFSKHTVSSSSSVSNSSLGVLNKSSPSTPSSDTSVPDTAESDIYILMLTPDAIIYSDGSRKVKGDFLDGFKIEKIFSNYVLVSDSTGVYRVSLSSLRRSSGRVEQTFNVSAKPGTINPSAAKPGTINPGAAKPGTINPGAAKPGTINPGAAKPGTIKPGAAKPETIKPGAVKSGTASKN